MYMISRLLNNAYMKTVQEINRDNLKLLEQEFGSLKAIADLMGKSHSQVSQWKSASKNSGTGKPRNIGPASAREIEKACNKPLGWLDQPHDGDPREEQLVAIFNVLDDRARETLLTVARSLAETSSQAPA